MPISSTILSALCRLDVVMRIELAIDTHHYKKFIHMCRAAASIYHVPDRNIIGVAIKLESIQEQQDTNLVESYNQQHVSIWIISHICIPLVQFRVYIDWELCESYEIRILIKSRYSEILKTFGLPKSTLCSTLNMISLPLKCSYLKHPWYLIGFDQITKRNVI